MKKKIWILGIILLLLIGGSLFQSAEATNKFWWASCRTGGGDCLDGIDGATLTAGDGAIVALDAGSTTPEIYFYRVYASSASESDPLVIAPDSNPGTLRWHLVNLYGRSMSGIGVDGENRVKINNNTSRTPAANANELFPLANKWHLAENGADTGEIATDAKTLVFTNKTFDAAATGNVLKQTKYLMLTHPDRCDETGAVMQTTKTTADYGQCKFSASAAYAANFAKYYIPAPPDLDTAVDLIVAAWNVKLDNTDTGIHCYKIEVAVVAASAAYDAATGTTINLGLAADASGAAGDMEAVTGVTLTGWKSVSGIGTAGNLIVITVGRDGGNEGSTACASGAGSTVASYSGPLVISYGSVQ